MLSNQGIFITAAVFGGEGIRERCSPRALLAKPLPHLRLLNGQPRNMEGFSLLVPAHSSTYLFQYGQCHPVMLSPPREECAEAGTRGSCRVVWWVDPVGAILISCYIVWSWIGIASEQMNQMVRDGSPAPRPLSGFGRDWLRARERWTPSPDENPMPGPATAWLHNLPPSLPPSLESQ